MKKLLAIVVLGLLMISCSEDNSTSKKKETSEMNKYLNTEITSKLVDIQYNQRLNNENSTEDNLKLFKEPSVFRMYSLVGGTIVFCHSWEESYKATNSSDTKSEFLENMDKEIEKKCKIFRDFHYQYDSVFKQIANTKKIPPFYYFDFKTEDSDETDTFGLFKTKEECSSFSKMIQKELNYFILECKYFKGV